MAYSSSTTRTSPRPAAEPGCISGASRSSHGLPARRQPGAHGRTVPRPAGAGGPRTVRSGRCQASRPIVDSFSDHPQIADEPPIWVLTRVDLEMGRPPVVWRGLPPGGDVIDAVVGGELRCCTDFAVPH